MSFIKLIGVELEGAWDSDPARKPNAEWHSDGSVNFDDSYSRVGEVVMARPGNLEKALEFMDDCYPDATNDTCGLHIHLSFKSVASYMCLMDKRFHEDFKTWARKWGEDAGLGTSHRLWPRLDGKKQYCQDKFHPDKQLHVMGQSGERYTQLNYCMDKHGTLENRLFPCFVSASTAKSALTEYVAFVEAWLTAHSPSRGLNVGCVVVLDDASGDTTEAPIEVVTLEPEVACAF